jgi:para-aminobenzoate synthetase component I
MQQYWWQKMNALGANQIPFLFLLDYELKKPLVLPLSEIDPSVLRWSIGMHQSPSLTQTLPSSKAISFERFPINYKTYLPQFERVMSEIKYGNSFLLNLTLRTQIKCDASLQSLFESATARYKVYLKGQFTCFSPEIFIRINAQGRVSSYPMKGTIDATLPNAEQILLADTKEIAEHFTIVDLIRNDLSMIARQVEVVRFRYIERLKTNQKDLLQASSEIVGQLGPEWESQIGSMFKKLLPAGSISGAPKKKTREIIQEVEGMPRGYYTGVCGVYDGNTLDSGVMIRYIEEKRGKLFFRSGGGITCLSEARSEYDECIAKVYLPS